MKRSSIRTRLLLASVLLVAVGLLVADGATYSLLRKSLLNRIDQQLLGARFFAARSVQSGVGGFGGPGGDTGTQVAYAELLDRSGNVVSGHAFNNGFGDYQWPAPSLPAPLPGAAAVSTNTAISFMTVRAASGSLRYRVLANAVEGGGTLVVAIPLSQVEETLHRLVFVEVLATAGALLALALAAQWAIRVGLRPLEQMEATAAEIAAGDLSRRVEPSDASTEIGRLGIALNAMLEKIETSFAEKAEAETKLRRFIADASHELRTPLTSIRGYAELFRRGAGQRPEDLEKSMNRIEDEAARMGVLVDELLLLARLDQGRPLERAPFDLAVVARDAVEDARTVQPERSIELNAAPVMIEGDEAR
ncbi:MAG: HAMP domain-containing histidine kinase, partial [Actinobacteria bacterium]|nr:HAMP domain-containing histidine kinase [Actinomycetota bacterium]